MKRYEGMFLFDNTTLHQWAEMEAEIKRLIGRIEAELLVCVKFDERRLAYEINGRKRGTYILTYFDADPLRIGELERDARLSESILRLLVLRPENLTEEKLAELKAHPAEQSLQPHSSDSRRDSGGYRERSDRGDRFDRPERRPRDARPKEHSAADTKPDRPEHAPAGVGQGDDALDESILDSAQEAGHGVDG